MSIFMAELLGTMILILFGSGVVAGVVLNKSKAQNSGWIVITTAWAIGVAIPAFIFGGISGAHLNPALTIALAIIGQFSWAQVPVYIVAQFLGAMIGATLVWLAYLPHWAETDDKGAKLGVFSTGPAIRNLPANFLTEVIATFILVFVVLSIGVPKSADGLSPLVVGLLILALGLAYGGPTGYALNPARDLGPRIMHALLPIAGKGDSDWNYSWVPVFAPIVGGILGALLFNMVF